MPGIALDLAREFSAASRKVWLVGGWVRDALLGNADEADLDFATEARPQEILAILKKWSTGKVWTTGLEFGTVGAQKGDKRVEVTTFRREVYREESRNPEVTFADDLETDLSRRDFTMNALAIAVPEVSVVDPFGGLADLAGGRIRTPLDPHISFSDDPLRMLRAFRFSSTLGFEVDESIVQAVSEMHQRLQIVSSERVRDEFSKLLMGKRPSRALFLTTESGLAGEFLPELPALKLEQDPIHRHKDVFMHTLAVLENVMEKAEDDLSLRLAALLHDIGKPKTRRIGEGGVSFHHHEVVGAEMSELRMKQLRFPGKLIQEVRELVFLHLRFHTYRLGWSDKAVRRYVRDAGGLLGKLNTLVRADCTTRNPAKARQLNERMDELEARIRDLASREELMAMRPALDGNEIMSHLGMEPGPAVGEARDFLMEIRMEEGEITKEEAKKRLDEWWGDLRNRDG
ncbi:MAG: CCA tRNA nucleotidyltransferase [Actinobacteria bacterium]|nr:CCA tRNA nucleotidyltransferase [Actinomycetota bacterium]